MQNANSHASHETVAALRNGIKLVGSLTLTYGIALAVRIFLPRYLGPETFGEFNWADGFSAAFFVVATLGVDTYIRKEVTLRPDHANEFFAGTVWLRIAMTGAILVAMNLVMHSADESTDGRRLVYVMALGQLFYAINGTLAAMLHARGKVDGLSVSNVVTKLLWGGGLLLALMLRAPLPWLGVPLLVSEFVKGAVLYYLARKHVGLKFHTNLPATWHVLKVSFPFYVNNAALFANGRFDITILGLQAPKEEVGWYGAAFGIAGLTMLMSPIIGWVLMPLLSHAGNRSEEEFFRMMRRTLELILTAAIPVTLAMAVGAKVWVRLMYGEAFAPAALPLKILAPTFAMTYICTVTGICLTLLNRPWTVTITSILGMLLDPLLNLILIRPFLHWIGPTGGAAATATSLVLTEIVVTSMMIYWIGRRAFDRRNIEMLVKTVAICLFIVALDRLVLLPLGPFRLAIDAVVYIALALVTRAVRVGEIIGLVRMARSGPAAVPIKEAGAVQGSG